MIPVPMVNSVAYFDEVEIADRLCQARLHDSTHLGSHALNNMLLGCSQIFARELDIQRDSHHSLRNRIISRKQDPTESGFMEEKDQGGRVKFQAESLGEVRESIIKQFGLR